jgi:Restriction endonuclease EcoRII, N-terminal
LPETGAKQVTAEVRKRLSANDVGTTGGHQAGILVPKEERILSFFPSLEKTVRNPRMKLVVFERQSRERWEFNFIYYNNKLFGEGTRNEYRLTGMTGFMRAIDAKVDDALVFSRDENASLEVDIIRSNASSSLKMDGDTLVLGGGWTVIHSS